MCVHSMRGIAVAFARTYARMQAYIQLLVAYAHTHKRAVTTTDAHFLLIIVYSVLFIG